MISLEKKMHNLVTLNNANLPITTSRIVANAFGKRHDNVMRAIHDLAALAASDGCPLNFEGVSYRGDNGEDRPMIVMDEEAFALLVMGFTGKEALEWKRKFIKAFKLMRDKLVAPMTPIEQAEYNLAQWKKSEALRLEAEAKLAKVSELVPLLTPYYQAQKLITASKELYTPREAAKIVSMGPKNFMLYLEREGWVWRNRDNDIVPNQAKINAGTLVYKFFDYEVTKEYYDHPRPGYRAQVLITSKGLDVLAKQIAKDVE
jgi:Rha family phage regulatory protein